MALNDIHIPADKVEEIMLKAEGKIFMAGLLYHRADEFDAAKERIVRDLFGDECLRLG